LIGSLAIALAGCGGGDSGVGNAGTGSSPNSVADTAPPANTGGGSTGSGSGGTTPPTGGSSTVTPPPASSGPTSVSLAWQPPTQNTDGSPITNLAGYKVHYGTTSGDYTQTVAVNNAGLTRYVLDNLKSGTYYFAITAYNAQGTESTLSGELSTIVN
jgi:hypothetical protein